MGIVPSVHNYSDHIVNRAFPFHSKGCYPPSNAQGEVPQACVALVGKLNILIHAVGVKSKTIFPRHQVSSTD